LCEAEFNELNNFKPEKTAMAKNRCIKKLQNSGFLRENIVQKIEHPATFDLEHIVNNQMGQLILQVTQQCNLRCRYCAYSGNYYNREHSSQRMSQETARKAIDFFMERSTESKKIFVSFYGGEPFLELDLIKNTILYCQQKYGHREIRFNLTTNGTLLNVDIIRYLIENDIVVTVSLDGSKEEHDANRVTADGKGTFDKIIKNLRMIEGIDNDYFKNNILFNTVINPKAKLGCVEEYFSTSELFKDSQIIFTDVVTHNLKDKSLIKYNEDFWVPRNFEYLKLLLYLIGKISEKSLSVLVKNLIQKTDDYARLLDNRIPQKDEHHSGPCVPGAKRLFVTVDGKLYPCERVSEQFDCFCIGSLEEGLDLNKISYILNCGKLSEDECKHCWNLLLCSICLSKAESSNKIDFTKREKLACCNKSLENSLYDLKEYCTLREFGYRRTYTKEESRI
jgi:uncharacterized protein